MWIHSETCTWHDKNVQSLFILLMQSVKRAKFSNITVLLALFAAAPAAAMFGAVLDPLTSIYTSL